MNRAKELATKTIELREKATPGKWTAYKCVIHNGEENGHEKTTEQIAFLPLKHLDSGFVGDEQFISHTANTSASLAKMLLVALPALEWVVRPGHKEPDDYTQLACAIHRANEALETIKKLAEEVGNA